MKLKKLIFIVALSLCATSLIGCSSSKKDEDKEVTAENNNSKEEAGKNDKEKETKPTENSTEAPKEKVYLEEQEIDKAYSNPDGYSGKYMKISGQVFGEPEIDGSMLVFQMNADPKKQEKNTVVVLYAPNVTVNSDDYVVIDGRIEGSFEYQNAFGGTISALQINAQSVEKSSYAEAVDPAQKTIEANMPIQQHGYTVIVEKVEFTQSETRVYMKVSNGGSGKFNFYDFNAKIVQNGTQYEKEYNYSAGYQEIQSDLLQGAETSGIIPFPAIDPNSPFQLYCEARSDNWDEDFEPFVFNITP